MEFVQVALKEDVPSGKMKEVQVKGTAILLVNLDGEYYAIGNKCTHRGCKLSKGTLNGEIIKCPCHGSHFNIRTGEALGGPAAKHEQKYEVKTEQDQIYIEV